MTPNRIRNHRRQHKGNWIVANGTRTRNATRTGVKTKNDNHNNVLPQCQPEMAKMTEIFHRSPGVSTTYQWSLNNFIFILNQNTSTHNTLHFTAISITTWFILLQFPPQHGYFYCNIHHNMLHFTQDTPQPGSFYCNITTCFILLGPTIPITACFIFLQYASFYCNINRNMLHFTGTCFISLE